MPYKDKNRQRDYERDYVRKRSAEPDSNAVAPAIHTYEPITIETAADLRRVLELIINEILPANFDLATKGRTIASLLNVGAQLVKLTGIEERLEKLEQERPALSRQRSRMSRFSSRFTFF